MVNAYSFIVFKHWCKLEC